ncbi:type II toxin-antitoxin system VapC family toxin [Nitrincola sp.]|uniref:type II toxin-antitoxin system VapC family toxin n=1 Tax=Nitrincola sp. TaxID=1926584 RepID=UPI003A93839F
MWVLDTNTLIYFFKGLGNVGDILLSHAPGDIGIPSIVLYELEVGIAKSTSAQKRREQLKALTTVTQLLPFGSAEAEAAARIRVSLEKQGTPIGPYDLLIAGTALAQNATLVTRNTREFNRIKKLQVENWY